MSLDKASPLTTRTEVTVSCWLEQHAGLPRQEREWLVCQRLQLNLAGLMAHPDRLISTRQQDRLAADVSRLVSGEPLAYIFGEWDFWDFTLRLSPDVLIPRPETETLVEQALRKVCPGDRVLDLGTGSGAIAIAMARSANATVLAVDHCDAALAVAEDNAIRLAAPVSFRRSRWFDDVIGTFQVIVANPPYVAAADPHLAALRFEPQGALVAGTTGLEDLGTIIRNAPLHLTDGGWLLVEHGCEQADPVADLFRDAAFQSIELICDLADLPRVTLGRYIHPRPDA